jgi:DNA mismatch repair protein MSH3
MEAAWDMLAVMDEAAAASNNRIDLFTSQERFPALFAARADLAAAERQLSGLLPPLRRQLGLPRLEYVSVQNQGDYLIEVPAERKDVPRVRADGCPKPVL